jgi:hypothetical protein
MGEQVAGKAGHGWFDGVRVDLEAEGYASRAVDIPACAVDSPQKRSRLYWLSVACTESVDSRRDEPQRQPERRTSNGRINAGIGRNGSFWSDSAWTQCVDGKSRRIEPSTPMLVNGFPGRLAAWRGVGNAIVPQVAAEVIAAFMDVTE